MATGINVEKLNCLKVDILSYIESVNSLSNRLDDCCLTVTSNLVGPGSNEIISQINDYINQLSDVSSKINSYIQLLNQVETGFNDMDIELAANLTNNIKKLDQFGGKLYE